MMQRRLRATRANTRRMRAVHKAFRLILASLLCSLQAVAPFSLFQRRTFVLHSILGAMTKTYDEEKKDDGILYWEPSLKDEIQLPSFSRLPKMIVFDKDGAFVLT